MEAIEILKSTIAKRFFNSLLLACTVTTNTSTNNGYVSYSIVDGTATISAQHLSVTHQQITTDYGFKDTVQALFVCSVDVVVSEGDVYKFEGEALQVEQVESYPAYKIIGFKKWIA